jgi:YD repeat-containing protein
LLSSSLSISATTNRITELGYNAPGNVTSDPATNAGYTYDAENRMLTSSSTLGSGFYVYDANGRRVRKTVDTNTITDFIYDTAGNVVAE